MFLHLFFVAIVSTISAIESSTSTTREVPVQQVTYEHVISTNKSETLVDKTSKPLEVMGGICTMDESVRDCIQKIRFLFNLTNQQIKDYLDCEHKSSEAVLNMDENKLTVGQRNGFRKTIRKREKLHRIVKQQQSMTLKVIVDELIGQILADPSEALGKFCNKRNSILIGINSLISRTDTLKKHMNLTTSPLVCARPPFFTLKH